MSVLYAVTNNNIHQLCVFNCVVLKDQCYMSTFCDRAMQCRILLQVNSSGQLIMHCISVMHMFYKHKWVVSQLCSYVYSKIIIPHEIYVATYQEGTPRNNNTVVQIFMQLCDIFTSSRVLNCGIIKIQYLKHFYDL